MLLRLTALFVRSALYGATVAFLLWKLYGFPKLIEIGELSRADSIRQVVTMTSVMIFVALLAWLSTWKYEQEYGTKIAILLSGLLNGVGLVLFVSFVLGTIPPLVWNTRAFLAQEDLVFFLLVIPAAVVCSVLVDAMTSRLARKQKVSINKARPDSWRTLKL